MVWKPLPYGDKYVVKVVGVATADPVPLSATVCVEPVVLPELSVTIKLALRLPVAPGVKVTEMLQEAFAVRAEPQLFEALKSEAFVPLTAIPAMVNAAEPLLLRVMVCALLVVPSVWLGKVSEVGEAWATGIPTVATQLLTRLVTLTDPNPLARS